MINRRSRAAGPIGKSRPANVHVTGPHNAILAAASYNFRRLIRWLRILLHVFLAMLFAPPDTRVA
jgi:hypothetical protein